MPSQTYDDSNIFAKILRGELPAHRVREDAETLAILDIMPRGNGHTLILPKKPMRNLLDADTDILPSLIEAAQIVAKACVKAFDADGITIQQFNEAAGGQEVFHLHLHVIPRMAGVPLKAPGTMENDDILTANAERIRQALA